MVFEVVVIVMVEVEVEEVEWLGGRSKWLVLSRGRIYPRR
jgi:hypothetical protein